MWWDAAPKLVLWGVALNLVLWGVAPNLELWGVALPLVVMETPCVAESAVAEFD